MDVATTSRVVVHSDICQIAEIINSRFYSRFFEFGKPNFQDKTNLYTGKILLLSWNQECIVFQLKAVQFVERRPKVQNLCKLKIDIAQYQVPGKEMSLSASGFIDGNHLIFLSTQSIQNSMLV